MVGYDDLSLYNALKELEVIEKNKLEEAFNDSKTQKVPLESLLIQRDLISEENIGRTIADLTSTPFIHLSDVSIPQDVLQIIPEIVAKKQRIIAFKKDAKGIHLAMEDPTNIQTKDFIEKKVGLPVIAYVASKRDINNAIYLYHEDIHSTFDEIMKTTIQDIHGADKVRDELPIIKIVDTILLYAYQNHASDIHIEPLKNECLVRFRIDGILHDIIRLPLMFEKPIVTRIKVLSDLRTDEHRVAQDGKLQFKTEEEDLDVRTSIVPITNGEKVVMRLLSEHSRQYSLNDLGFAKEDLIKVEKAYIKPYGMILATGPTGSGKTTTIYAIIKLVNKRDVNIMTIEDPVEYDMLGVNQIQVNTQTNLNFAEGLRSIVRQDPNIIFVGEIRDEETADIAINSAMTGHLVLSTLHTNDAATAIPRLLDMGVEPFLVASTVNIIIAQRLVRKIHFKCRKSFEVSTEKLGKYFDPALIKKVFGNGKSFRIYEGKGCPIDHEIGYEGRIGIFETLVINEEIRKAIIERKDAETIRKIAMQSGMTTMMEDGLAKIKEGLTTIDEVVRVTKE